jgi:hypothetical protein
MGINGNVDGIRMRLALLCTCIATGVFLQACSDRRLSFYASMNDAIKAGEVDRGWIPDYLPASSHTIRVIRDPASARTWCAFEFSPTDSQGFRRNLTNVSTLPELLKRSWCPTE